MRGLGSDQLFNLGQWEASNKLQGKGTTNTTARDIATTRINWPMDWFSENYMQRHYIFPQTSKLIEWTCLEDNSVERDNVYESYPVITTFVRKKCENIITPPFQFDHLPTQVSKSPYRLKVSESAIIFANLFGGLAPTDLFVSKKPKILKFYIWVKFETWTLKYQKSVFFKLLVFLGHVMKRCAFPFFGKQFHN